MKHWTTQAERRLAEYLRERVAREALTGAEAEELKGDLRSHIHEEAERSDGEKISLMQLESILGRLDAGYRPQPEWRGKAVAPRNASFRRFVCWTFGVVLPLAILIFEMLSSFCGSVFFDPIPTWWHVALVAMVPAVNFCLLRGTFSEKSRTEGIAAGFALVVAVFYGLLFLPLIHLSAIALLFIGMGLLSLTPVFAAWSTWRIGRAARFQAAAPPRYKSGWRIGLAAALLAILMLEGPGIWTRTNLLQAMSGDEGSESAIARLRTWHSERSLLNACYEGNRRTYISTDISGWLLGGWTIPVGMMDSGSIRQADPERVRDLFFRVTGKPFNSVRPPDSARGGKLMGRPNPLEDFQFDDHLGGDDVAVRVRHLDLAQSRFDGHLDPVSKLGYGEWTMVFRNRSGTAKEARCQVRLPRGGHVSRLTLWVNGEPREAAFNTVSKVKAAYRAVAVVQRLDPVLVNVAGPDTVMVQCFPVPPQGEMKIRLGITAPLDGSRWELPHIIERNFGTERGLEHALWLQSDRGFELVGGDHEARSVEDGSGQSLAVTLETDAAMSDGIALSADDIPDEPLVWCEDRFAKPEERILIREMTAEPSTAGARPILVIDGSASMSKAASWVTQALAGAAGSGWEIILADDTARQVTLAELKNHRFSGGRDNEPALREAIRRAKENAKPVVWIHGPQAVRLSQPEALLQLIERGTRRPLIIGVEAVTGPNRLAEAIYRTGCLHRGPALVNPAEDLTKLLANPHAGQGAAAWQWRRAASSDSLTGRKVWDHLARHWAAITAEDLSASMSEAGRAELAARYQLVTRFSGAVVLETQQQYDDHGLEPVDGDATPGIPNIPEPSSGLLVMLAAAAALLRRRREPATNPSLSGRP
jgi:hypothetical protein